MKHADSLFSVGSYFEASVEYERVYFESGSANTRVIANLRKAGALKQIGAFNKARRDLQRSLIFRGNDSLRIEILYQVAFSAYMSGMMLESNSMLLQIRNNFGQVVQNRIFLLEALVKVEMQQWGDLREHLIAWIDAFSGDNHKKNEILSEYDVIFAGSDWDSEKDPDRARLWSTFVPGAGQLYAGEPGRALLNAFSQLAGLAGFGLLAYNGFYVASIVAGLGSFQSFYFGGIKQAHELTVTTNKSRLDDLQTALRIFLFDVAAFVE